MNSEEEVVAEQLKKFLNNFPKERRRRFLLRAIWSWFLDVDVDTLEKNNINFKFILIIAILLYGSTVLVVPPPYVLKYALVLPVYGWATLLAVGMGVQLWGRRTSNFCLRAKGALLGLMVCGGILGPLILKGYSPAFYCFQLYLSFSEVILWVRLSRECRCLKKNCANK